MEVGEINIDVIVGDGIDDNIIFVVNGISGDNFIFVVIDDNNIILVVLEGNIVNFEGVGIGVCCVWGLFYFGNFIVEVG